MRHRMSQGQNRLVGLLKKANPHPEKGYPESLNCFLGLHVGCRGFTTAIAVKQVNRQG